MKADENDLLQARKTLEKTLGYRFLDTHVLTEALTHKSFSNEQTSVHPLPHNERLEFLGDAVLGLIVSDYVFSSYPDLAEGQLTRIRAEVVNEKSLSDIGRSIGLGDVLLLGRGEELSGGRHKDSLIADAFEALLGAVFTDSNFETTRSVVLSIIADSIKYAAERKKGIDFKTRFQEWLQARKQGVPSYETISAEGPDHKKVFTCQVSCGGKILGRGRGRTKKAAEQEAARQALQTAGE